MLLKMLLLLIWQWVEVQIQFYIYVKLLKKGVNFYLEDINKISKRVSSYKNIPSLSTVHMEDINKAGSVNAVMKEMTKRGDDILLDNLTISGETILEKSKMLTSKIQISFTIDNPYSQVGGLAILYGNLAEQGAVIKLLELLEVEFSEELLFVLMDKPSLS